MSNLEFFKKQAKNLHKDFKTRFFNEESKLYEYKPKYFDIGKIFIDFDFPDYKDDFTFTLMNAQHLIAKMVGFNKWDDLIHASETELELAKILLRHFHNHDDIWDWKNVLIFAGKENADISTKIKYARMYYDDYTTGTRGRLNYIKPKLTDTELHEIELARARPKFEGLKLTSPIVCSHCFQEYRFRQAELAFDSENKELFVCCKNPKCNYDAYSFIYDSSVYDGRVPPEF